MHLTISKLEGMPDGEKNISCRICFVGESQGN